MAQHVVLWDNTNGRFYDSGQAPASADARFRANTATIGSGAVTLTITFSSSVPDTNYAIDGSFENTTDTNVQFQPWTVTARTTGGFTIKWSSATLTANTKFNYRTSSYA